MDNNMMNNTANNGVGDNVNVLLADAENVCRNLGGYSFSALLSKRIELTERAKNLKLQSMDFVNFDKMIYNQLLILQQNEAAAYKARIGSADYEGLKVIKEEISKKGYSSQVCNELNQQIAGKMANCQMELLNAKTAGYENMSRLQIRELIEEIKQYDYNKQIIDGFVSRLNTQADVAEQKELNYLCANVEEANLTELAILLDKISAGGYKAEFAGRYISLINNRIDFVHTENMRRICDKIEECTREEVKVITKQIDDEECNQNLKTQFYGMINKRIEVLDFDELTRLTENVDELDIEELQELKQQILDGSYSKKFVKEFILKVRLQLEKLQYNDIMSNAPSVDEMSRGELENAYKELCAKKYEDRVIAFEKEKISDKIFELDMLKLIEICNDFDMLDKERISQVQMRAEQFDVSERSKKIYLDRLETRKMNYALEMIQPYAYIFNTLSQNFSASSNSIKLATFSQDYLEHYKKLKEECKELKEYEVPVFIMTGSPYLAMSRERVYCVLQDGLNSFGLEEIHSFNAVSRFLASSLTIIFRNGQSVALPGNAGRNATAFANMLNQFITVLPNPPQNINPVKIHTENFNINEFKIQKKYDFSIEACKNKTVMEYSEFVKEAGSIPLKLTGTPEWASKENKIRGSYGISVYEPVICYFDGSFFSGGKDGIAIGENFVFVKRAGVNTNLQLEKIYQISVASSGDRMQVEGTDNNTFIIDCVVMDNEKITKLAEIFDRYIKNIQFIKALDNKPAKIVLEKEKLCNVCKKPVSEGMIFCMHCGNKIEW